MRASGSSRPGNYEGVLAIERNVPAVIGGILGVGDPGENARRMRASLDRALG